MNRLSRSFFVSLVVCFAACGLAASPLRVVATTGQVGDIARAIGGDAIELTVLMGPGVDPHLFKATSRDVIALRRAKLVLYNGLHLEGRLGETFEKMDRLGIPIVAVGDAIPKDRLLKSADYADSFDPHVWFDPQLWVYAVDATEAALAKAAPEHASEFAERAKSYRAAVSGLQGWAEERIARIPEGRRVLVTSHDAYNYFGRAFGIEVVGVQGVSTATEAGIADITQTADFIKRRGIPAIFVESSVSPATIERISRDSGARVGGELFSDALGAKGELHDGADGERFDVGTYIGVFKYNVDTIVRALAD